jgi:DNA invertase Pin-like site-specific DNA recombinase
MTDRDARAEVATELGSGAVQEPRSGIQIGYARCSTEKQDLSAQREILRGPGVTEERVYLDDGLTGTNRSRPGLNSALAALREGDTLVVPKLDRLARSVPDA